MARVGVAGLIALSSITLAGGAAQAAHAASDVGAETTAKAVEALQKANGITEAQALTAFDAQKKAGGLRERIYNLVGPDFAQMWLDPAAGNYVLAVKPTADQAALRALLQDAGLPDTQIEIVDWSYDQAQRDVRSVKSELQADGVTSYRVGIATDGIEVDVPASAKKRDAGLQSSLEAIGSTPVELQVQPTASFDAEPTGCNSDFCDPPLIAGVHYGMTYTRSGRYYASGCSTGFAARSKNSDDHTPYMLTAGHCIAGSTLSTCTPSACGYAIGSDVDGYYTRQDDVGYFRADIPSWPTYPGFRTFASGPTQTLPVRGAQGSNINDSYCHTGFASGTTCGTVKEQGVSTTYNADLATDGTTIWGKQQVNDLTRVDGACEIGGDSGGPRFNAANAYAVGINSGGVKTCPTSVGYYTDIVTAMQKTNTVVNTTP